MADRNLDRARRLATSTIGDVLDQAGVGGVVTGLVRRSGTGRAAGYAQTMQAVVGPLGSFTFEEFAVGKAFDAVVADAVLVIDLGGAEVSTFGGLAALTVSQRAAAGVLIDGACRDVEEIRALGVTVASRHVTPRTGKGRLKVAALGKPIACGGVTVRPGDLVVIDDTGAVVIPNAMIEQILAAAEELDRRDTAFAEKIKAGKTFAAAAAELKHA